MADPSDGTSVLAVTSLASIPQHIKVECLGESSLTTRQIHLMPGQTSIASACDGPDTEAAATDPLLGEPSAPKDGEAQAKAQGATGIRITSDGAPGAFAAFALAPHTDEGNRSFSSVLFSDPQAAHSSGIVFAGVPVGSASLLPAGDYVPHLSLANFSDVPAHIHISFAHNGSNEAATPQEVGSVSLPPHTSREMKFANLIGDPDLKNSFVVVSDAAPGMLAAKFVAQGGPRLHRVELQAKDERDEQNGGAHPWSIENGTDSTLLLFNHSTVAQKFTVAIGGSETWQKTLTLTAMQTQAVSLRDLIESRAKDDKGRTLPANVRSGELHWFVPDSTQSSGRLLHTDRATGMARNYSCGYNNLLCGASVTIYTAQFADGTTDDFAVITPITCTSGTNNACSGQQTGSGGSFSTSWASGSPNIASIAGSNAVSSVYLTGNAAGSSGINGRIQSTYCSAGGGGKATVQTPTSLRVVQTITNGAASCPSGQSGWQRIVNRAVVDQNGHDIQVSNQTVSESFTFPAGQNGFNLNGHLTTGTGVTNALGQYIDRFQVCSSGCPGTITTTAT